MSGSEYSSFSGNAWFVIAVVTGYLLFILLRAVLRQNSESSQSLAPEAPDTDLSNLPDFLSKAIPATEDKSPLILDGSKLSNESTNLSQPKMSSTTDPLPPNQIGGPRKHYTPIRQPPFNPQIQPTEYKAPKATSALSLGWRHLIWPGIAVLAILVAAVTFRYETVYIGGMPWQKDRWTGTVQWIPPNANSSH